MQHTWNDNDTTFLLSTLGDGYELKINHTSFTYLMNQTRTKNEFKEEEIKDNKNENPP
jgi:hypothetical protein